MAPVPPQVAGTEHEAFGRLAVKTAAKVREGQDPGAAGSRRYAQHRGDGK